MNTRPILARSGRNPGARGRLAVVVAAVMSASVLVASVSSFPQQAFAATTPVGRGTAATYSVLGGQAVTNTGSTTLSGDLGVSPGSAITGFPPGTVGGATHAADAAAAQAQADVVTAYNDAAGRPSTAAISGDLVGQTLVDGVYTSAGPIDLSGTLTLDAQGDPSAVFIFQIGSTLTTSSSSTVALINGAQACNVYWQVGSSATLGFASGPQRPTRPTVSTAIFKGTVLALTSITVIIGTAVEGQALARNGSVTLASNVFTGGSCAASPSASPSPLASPSASDPPSPSASASPSGSASGSPSASASASPSLSPSPTASASPSASEAATPASGSSSKLAATGASPVLGVVLGLGALLLVAGSALLIVRLIGRRPARFNSAN